MNMIAPFATLGRQRLVLVGNGMAGVRALEEILARVPNGYQVTVFGAEPHGNYNRIMLSPVLAGEKQFADIVTHDRDWYADRGIELLTGEPVVEINRAARQVGAHPGCCGTMTCSCSRPGRLRSCCRCRARTCPAS